MPEAADTSATEPRRGSVHLQITYFTDPLCCWSWGFEPQLRRLRHAFAGHIAWRIRMGGMIPTWNSFDDPLNSVHRPGQMGPLWLMASRQTGMPMNVALWTDDPPHSSWPACLAVKAAEMQSPAAADLMLRTLREAVMMRGRNVADDTVLLHEAAGLAERFPDLLSLERFEADVASPEARKLLEDDVKEARYREIGRFPALLLRRPGSPAKLLVGWRPYANLLAEVTAYAPDLGPERRPTSPEAYRAYWHSITDREVDAGLEPAATAPEPMPSG